MWSAGIWACLTTWSCPWIPGTVNTTATQTCQLWSFYSVHHKQNHQGASCDTTAGSSTNCFGRNKCFYHQISMPVSTSALRCYLTWVCCCIWWSRNLLHHKQQRNVAIELAAIIAQAETWFQWVIKKQLLFQKVSMPLVIWAGAQRHGALWVTWSGRWEHFHQVLKLIMYRASSIDCRC